MCSSAVTTHFVFATAFKIASLSKGLMVCKLITSAEIPSDSKVFAASKASQTKCPVANIVKSVPFLRANAYPISKSCSEGVKLGTAGLPKRK